MRRTKRLVALAAGLAIVAAACGGDDDNSAATTAAPATTGGPATTEGSTTTTAAGATTTAAAAGGATTTTGSTTPVTGGTVPTGATKMTITVDLDPKAVWEDGSPITADDLTCTWQANLQTPGSVQTAGYDQITGVDKGTSDKQAVIKFKSVYGPYKTLFNQIIKKASVKDCTDVSGDFQTELKTSARPYMMQSWSLNQSVFVPNPKYWGTDKAKTSKIVFVPQTDQPTEIASIKAGTVDYIYPQFSDALSSSLQDPNIKLKVENGTSYEAMYFQMKDGPLADPVFRQALSESIDRQAIFNQIYAPIFKGAGMQGALLNCGPIVEGPYCPADNFQDTYKPDDAAKILTDAGWKKNGQGFWAKDGKDAPKIRWMINSGNKRRESTQDFLIPLLAKAGFQVVADNCESSCVFQQRLPALDYDVGMYISNVTPDPTYLIPILTCDNIPTAENGNKGQNYQGWCNQKASDELHQSDITADQTARTKLIEDALRATDTDHVLLPLVNYPNSAAWLPKAVGGPVDGNLSNYRGAFADLQNWTDANGDGQIVIGAEQWPSCLNLITECANSSWYVWTVSFLTQPAIWDPTEQQTYKITNLVTGEPVVKVL